ncbi:MAG: hypothetical protein ACN0LA_10105 [Candidatus Longimicrobiales bacterium M2_2A_002]
MAISDLLWACPECGEDRGLTPDGSAYRCRACDTFYRRDEGASIRARRSDGTAVVRTPAEWLDRLPDPETLVQNRDSDVTPVRRAAVDVARVVDSDTVHGRGGGYLNRIEIWGDESPAELALFPDYLELAPGDGEPERWPLESVTAVQASSSDLQINRTGAPLASFHFRDDSSFLWEELLHAALRDFYGRTGRGEVVEFQPRITTA